MTILNKILHCKRKEIDLLKRNFSYKDFEKFPSFNIETSSLANSIKTDHFGIIAEHKRMSPSKSIINEFSNFDEIINGYSSAGVSGISILTDKKYFGGSIEDITNAKKLTKLPILRKEFIIDEIQIIEAKANGADAILLISACLTKNLIKTLSECAKKLNLDVLVEIHELSELSNCLLDTVDIIGVNNRNLKTFNVNTKISKDLSKHIPNEFVKISESGISSVKEIIELQEFGFDGFLIGEKFMKKDNPGLEALNYINDLKLLK